MTDTPSTDLHLVEDTPPRELRIIRLTAANVMGLKVVDIAPDGRSVIIGGPNGSGKSSVLNAVFLALGGKAAKDIVRPVRDGATQAEVTVDLGELRVTRTWRVGSTRLIVEAADGTRFSSGQEVLNKLIGSLTFDPLEFMRKKPKDQVTEILGLIDLPFDLDALDRERQRLYDERRVVGQVERDLAGQLEALPDPGELPEAEVPIGELVGQLTARQREIADNREQRQRAATAQETVVRLRTEVAQLEAQLEARRADLTAAMEASTAADEWIATLVDPDVTEIEQALEAAEESNRRWREGAARRTALAAHAAKEAEYKGFTAQIEEIDNRKATALAEADMPIAGLSFDDDGVTFNGHPLADCCDAEKREVSIAIGRALNPELRIMMIRDGALLDDETLADITRAAGEDGFQLWIEDVGNDRASVLMEDGFVAVDRLDE